MTPALQNKRPFQIWPGNNVAAFHANLTLLHNNSHNKKCDLCPINGKRHAFYSFRTAVQEAYHCVPITSILTIYQLVLLLHCLQIPALIRLVQNNIALHPMKSRCC